MNKKDFGLLCVFLVALCVTSLRVITQCCTKKNKGTQRNMRLRLRNVCGLGDQGKVGMKYRIKYQYI